MKFKGNVVITNPTNVIRSKDDWKLCEYGKDLDKLGFKKYITFNGGMDSKAFVLNTHTFEKLGEFCSDSNIVTIFLLDEIKKYNPEFKFLDYDVLINDFDGDIQLEELSLFEGLDIKSYTVKGNGNIDFNTVYEYF